MINLNKIYDINRDAVLKELDSLERNWQSTDFLIEVCNIQEMLARGEDVDFKIYVFTNGTESNLERIEYRKKNNQKVIKVIKAKSLIASN